MDRNDWMWAQACELISQAERMHRQFFRIAASSPAQTRWEPPADVFEDEAEVLIVVALPGVHEDEVEVLADVGAIVVRARRPQPFRGHHRAVRQLEIPYGTFERRIALPPVAVELKSRELTHGCLLLRLRKIA